MTLAQERKAQAKLEALGWQRHHGIGGSYWTHKMLGDKCFGGRIDELLKWLKL